MFPLVPGALAPSVSKLGLTVVMTNAITDRDVTDPVRRTRIRGEDDRPIEGVKEIPTRMIHRMMIEVPEDPDDLAIPEDPMVTVPTTDPAAPVVLEVRMTQTREEVMEEEGAGVEIVMMIRTITTEVSK